MNTDLNGQAVDDAQALFKAAVRRVQADRLIDATTPHEWAPRPLSRYDEVRVAGMGKAAMAMAGVINDRQPGLVDEGVIGVPTGYPGSYPERLPSPSTVQVMEGGHPLPTEDSERAGRRLLDHARALGEGDLLLVPVSGGGTALSTLSADALDLPALRSTYRRLMEAGVPIHPANAVRKHLTQVGGGQLAATAHPAHVSALVVSDVPGNDLSAIASGPTVPDPSTYADAIQVLYRHDLWSDVPDSIRNHLAEGDHGQRGETPKPDTPCFDTARTTLIGTNKTALQAARAAAQERGYEVRSLETAVKGEAREVGRAHARRLLEAAPDGPTCWLWGGETTVTVTGEGTGGAQSGGCAGGRPRTGGQRPEDRHPKWRHRRHRRADRRRRRLGHARDRRRSTGMRLRSGRPPCRQRRVSAPRRPRPAFNAGPHSHKRDGCSDWTRSDSGSIKARKLCNWRSARSSIYAGTALG